MKKFILSIFAVSFVAIAAPVNAGTASITWQSPENYEDVKLENLDPDNEALNIRFSRIEHHLNRLAEMHLAENQELKLVVKDYDIAGQLQANTGLNNNTFQRRVLPNEFPEMVIDFELVDSQGNIIKSGQDVTIEGRAIRTEGTSRFPRITRRDEHLTAELTMLNRWFAEQFM